MSAAEYRFCGPSPSPAPLPTPAASCHLLHLVPPSAEPLVGVHPHRLTSPPPPPPHRLSLQLYDNRIDSSPDLQDLDEEFKVGMCLPLCPLSPPPLPLPS